MAARVLLERVFRAITKAAITKAAITKAAITKAAITKAAITKAAITKAAITKAAITKIEMMVRGTIQIARWIQTVAAIGTLMPIQPGVAKSVAMAGLTRDKKGEMARPGGLLMLRMQS
ncbi:unnamed protein product [Acidithrix sp. C25]|nr:unnamed protein product [Acidithrix sp. C25]